MLYLCSQITDNKFINNKKINIMENLETTTMRDILQLAIIKLKFDGNTEALYNIAFKLTGETDSFTFDFDSDQDILNTLEETLREKGFGHLDMNCTKNNRIGIAVIKLNTLVQ